MKERSLQSSNLRWGIALLAIAFVLQGHNEPTTHVRPTARLARANTVAMPVRQAAGGLIKAAATASVPHKNAITGSVRTDRLIQSAPRASVHSQRSKTPIV